MAWLRNGQVFESDDRSGSFQHKAGDRLPGASRMRPIVLGTTVLMAGATRIYARTEVL